MTKHRFAQGDRVRALPDTSNRHVPPGIYTILKVLPVAGFGCQYRAKNDVDAHERVLDDVFLQPAHG